MHRVFEWEQSNPGSQKQKKGRLISPTSRLIWPTWEEERHKLQTEKKQTLTPKSLQKKLAQNYLDNSWEDPNPESKNCNV